MMAHLVYPFTDNTFMLNAFMAGILVSIACGIVGTFMVLRGLSFIGDALAHGALPGIAIATLLGFPTLLGAITGALVMVFGISMITRKSNLSLDTAIGLLLVGMLALGVVIISRSHTPSGDLTQILFGETLGVGTFELVIQLIVTVIILILAITCYRPFLLLCFSPEQTETSGFSYRRYHMIMLTMIAMTIVMSFQTVGTMLVFGMLIAPAASAALFSRKILTMIIFASGIGVLSVYAGLLTSYHFNVAAGATIALVASIIFFVVLCIKQILIIINTKTNKKNSSSVTS
jgi:ABC-type Mn2+/Zn2+ transport system permease subunit